SRPLRGPGGAKSRGAPHPPGFEWGKLTRSHDPSGSREVKNRSKGDPLGVRVGQKSQVEEPSGCGMPQQTPYPLRARACVELVAEAGHAVVEVREVVVERRQGARGAARRGRAEG